MKRRRLTAVVAVSALIAAVLAGCGLVRGAMPDAPVATTAPSSANGIPIPVGNSQRTVTVDGSSRTYLVHRPAKLPAASSLVLMLHGGFGSAAQAEKSYGWDAEADAQHFVVAYPDGENHAWNVGGGCCGVPGRTGLDDVAFLSAVVSDLQASMAIDATRVYATGISNGGMMAYRFACDTGILAAIGPDSATLLGDCPSPHPLSVIAIHGTADQSIPYNGGEGTGIAKINGPPIPAVNQIWRTADDCAPPSSATSGDITTSTAACPDARSVELITIADAGHQWPGSAVVRPAADPPYPGLNATAVIWAFFAAHPATSS